MLLGEKQTNTTKDRTVYASVLCVQIHALAYERSSGRMCSWDKELLLLWSEATVWAKGMWVLFFTANPVVPCSLITNDTYYLSVNVNIVSTGF